MILIMKILLHNEYKVISLWYPTYVYQLITKKIAGLFSNQTRKSSYSQIFLSWHLGAERQTCHVTLIVSHITN